MTRNITILTIALGLGCHSSNHGSMDSGVDAVILDAGSPDRDATADADLPIDSGPAPDASRPARTGGWPDAPFPLGVPGWRTSRGVYCPPFSGDILGTGFQLWGDSRGLFAFAEFSNDTFGVGTGAPDGSVLMFNSGSGWVPWNSFTNAPGLTAPHRMAGAAGGPVYLQYGSCALRRTRSPTNSICLVTADPASLDQPILTPLTETTGYGVNFGGEAFDLAGEHFDVQTPLDFPNPVSFIWSDGVVHRAIMRSPAEFQLVGDEPTILASLGPMVHTWWVVGPDDIWVASGTIGQPNMRHWTATDSSRPPTELGIGTTPVLDMWGTSDKIYFIRSHTFGAVTAAGALETIVDLEDGTSGGVEFTSIWGDDASGDVYLAVTDSRYNRNACGVTFMLYYDGVELHQF